MSSILPMTYAKAKITPRHPIGSGFGADTTAAEVIRDTDLSGKTAIVTGGYSGIGLETTRTLVSAGAKVVVPGRDLSKATSALQGMPGVTTETLALMDPVSIDAFPNRFAASGAFAYFGEQCRHNGESIEARCSWVRIPILDEPLGTFPTYGSTVPSPTPSEGRTRSFAALDPSASGRFRRASSRSPIGLIQGCEPRASCRGLDNTTRPTGGHCYGEHKYS